MMAYNNIPEAEWSLSNQRLAEGIIRIAATNRTRGTKGHPIPATVIEQMVLHVLSYAPTFQQIHLIPSDKLRAALLVICQYYNLARASDCLYLLAGDVSIVSLDGAEAIEIHYRHQKNDQLERGEFSYILKESGPADPFLLFKVYFARMGFYFRDDHHDDSNYLFPRLRVLPGTKIQVSDGSFAISVSTLIDNVKNLSLEVGYLGKVTGKSAKISGVSDAFKQGLSDSDVRDKGRWRGLETAQSYRRIADSHRRKLAAATSIQTQEDEPVPGSRDHMLNLFEIFWQSARQNL